MNVRHAVYWTTTILTALSFLSGGVAYLARIDATVGGMLGLGYPLYFITILGAWKVLGSVAILAPRLPLLKEWAYAGIAFDLSGAALSHAVVGNAPVKIVVPLVLLAMAAASWALRPRCRRLGHAPGMPHSAVAQQYTPAVA